MPSKVEAVKQWVDRQLSGELENVIGNPGEFPIQIVETQLGLAVTCKGGVYLVETHQRIEIQTKGTA